MPQPPKPISLKIASGNPGKQKIDKDTAKAESSAAKLNPEKPPSYLPKAAKTTWTRIGRELDQLDLLKEIDSGSFADYCDIDARIKQASKSAKTTESVVMINGQATANPYLTALRQLMDLRRKLANELGLTPAGRARLHIKSDTGPDLLEQLIGG